MGSPAQTIELNGTESALFSELLAYAKSEGMSVVLRVAGGWVRDKLMGDECADIDIAIDSNSGHSFASGFMQYLREKKEDVSSFYLIPCNHEKSKHLETACLKFHGYSVDFVCLRTEKYTDSRVPSVQVGTPLEDAERRDLTINALFYRLDTGAVEDFTGKGLADLEGKIIRTPISPSITFSDDPLRILRTLRFAAKYNFTIAPEIIDALGNGHIVGKIATLVSAERIGLEIHKIIGRRSYGKAFLLMATNDIFKYAFKYPPETKVDNARIYRYIEAHSALLDGKTAPPADLPAETVSDPLVALYSVLHIGMGERIGKRKQDFLNVSIVSSSLKWNNAEKRQVADLEVAVGAARAFLSMKQSAETSPEKYRLALIRLVREAKGAFPTAVLILYLAEVAESETRGEDSRARVVDLSTMYRDVVQKKLLECWSVRGNIGHNDIRNLFRFPREETARILERAVELQLLYGWDSQDIMQRLKDEASEKFPALNRARPGTEPPTEDEVKKRIKTLIEKEEGA